MSEEKAPLKFRGKIWGNWWHVTPDDDAWEQFWSIADSSTIGQYIGVTDARGEDIYEGDILVLDELAAELMGIVERFYAGWIIQTEKGHASFKLTTDSKLFVIGGNIYDHPDHPALQGDWWKKRRDQ